MEWDEMECHVSRLAIHLLYQPTCFHFTSCQSLMWKAPEFPNSAAERYPAAPECPTLRGANGSKIKDRPRAKEGCRSPPVTAG